MGLVGIVQNDIKRVVAYSTLSQLGYMTVALGASAYSVAIFHLMTHAFFKALLFLAAGSVIIAMHHEQDIRAMGGLRRKMPITYVTSLIGSLALIGTPFFSGFYSKDAIILAASNAQVAGAGFAAFAVTIGVFITAFYSFRMFFLVFHGASRVDPHTAEHLHETNPVVTLPLIALAIPSVIIGGLTIEPILFGGFFDGAIEVAASHPAMAKVAEGFHGAIPFALHAFVTLPFYLALAGVAAAWYLYLKRPDLAEQLRERFSPLHLMLTRKYWCDEFNSIVFAGGGRTIGRVLWRVGDESVIDGFIVNGAANTVGRIARVVRHLQTGFLYHYAFAMIIGLLLLLTLFVMLAYF
jgi:NADH-quinone oxidoreductase subunit L